ncbi:hypothetical protein [Actinoallomurus acaciae]|uniref:Uncharacterized protein n=1 Tax=Actinoallomurus acaciae TaxID=502577 RepID=A0ABV5YSX0_9ACTN
MAVERLIRLAEGAGPSPTHLAMAFAVTSAIIGPRTMEHPDDEVLDQIVPPGTGIGPIAASCTSRAIARPAAERAAA